MDIFTDVDIFKEIVEASTRGISVYILLDESNFNHFLTMTEKQGCQVQRLRVRILCFVIFFFPSILFQSNFRHSKLYCSKYIPCIEGGNHRRVPLYFSKCDSTTIFMIVLYDAFLDAEALKLLS